MVSELYTVSVNMNLNSIQSNVSSKESSALENSRERASKLKPARGSRSPAL